MEIAIRKNIKDTVFPLKHKALRYTLGTLTGAAIALLSPATEGLQDPLEVVVSCSGSTPVVEVVGYIREIKGVNWLVTEEIGSRRFRVLERSNGKKEWSFDEQYVGFADPRSKYTEVPIGRFNFQKGKEYNFSVYSGGYSPRRTPLLKKRLHQYRKTIPTC